jgi:hypothetical protein
MGSCAFSDAELKSPWIGDSANGFLDKNLTRDVSYRYVPCHFDTLMHVYHTLTIFDLHEPPNTYMHPPSLLYSCYERYHVVASGISR